MILLDRQSIFRQLAEEGFSRAGHSLQPAYEVAYAGTALALVRVGLGVAVLPQCVEVLTEPAVGLRRIGNPPTRWSATAGEGRSAPGNPVASTRAKPWPPPPMRGDGQACPVGRAMPGSGRATAAAFCLPWRRGNGLASQTAGSKARPSPMLSIVGRLRLRNALQRVTTSSFSIRPVVRCTRPVR